MLEFPFFDKIMETEIADLVSEIKEQIVTSQKKDDVLKNKILDSTIEVFKSKGPKFTMDDLADKLGMSKKTIYTVFPDKRSLMVEMVEYSFDIIKESEADIYNNVEMTTVQKLRETLGVMPEMLMGFDFETIYQFKDKYPEIYKLMNDRLESGWEETRALYNAGVEEGVLKKIDFDVFQVTYEASIERMMFSDYLQTHNKSYVEALKELSSIMVDGIIL